ncbi:MAG TPA: alpha/beta hydrolase-fold protein [Candidatus Polarisedimenticolia bacterium]|nr:alpha/beta hydrolase-fold protein [Candidatus Polarisedimenticolia bacterium]
MQGQARIVVRYPAKGRGIVLRAGSDWGRDVLPVRVDDDGTRFEFHLAGAGAFCYFKPLLRDGGAELWSQGENMLAITRPGSVTTVHPHFAPDASCSVCTLHQVPSRILDRAAAVRVFLPPGYAENTLARHPVLYMQDGHNLFFPGESLGGDHWRIAETLQTLAAMSLVRRAIVVGIHPRDRMAEYTSPGYGDYGRFLCQELKPWVDATYRTLPGPADTTVMGSSLGGVVSFYLAWEHPGVFGNAGCLSSTFGWRDDLLDRAASEPPRPIRIYLDSGWPGDNYEVTRAMRDRLLNRGYAEGKDLLYFAYPRAVHDERHWGMRAHIPFQFFHGRGLAAEAA